MHGVLFSGGETSKLFQAAWLSHRCTCRPWWYPSRKYGFITFRFIDDAVYIKLLPQASRPCFRKVYVPHFQDHYQTRQQADNFYCFTIWRIQKGRNFSCTWTRPKLTIFLFISLKLMCSFAPLVLFQQFSLYWMRNAFCIQLVRAIFHIQSQHRSLFCEKNDTLGDYHKRTFSTIGSTPDCWRFDRLLDTQ